MPRLVLRAATFVAIGSVLIWMVGENLGLPRIPTDSLALAAILVAVITLLLVQEQIEIANAQMVVAHEQIEIANDQLKLARDEIALVQQDLGYSREQTEAVRAQMLEQNRRPVLRLTFVDGTARIELPTTSGTISFGPALSIHNDGNRTARGAFVELLVPWDALQPEGSAKALTARSDTIVSDGRAWRKIGFPLTDPCYVGLSRQITMPAVTLARPTRAFPMRWRVVDDFGSHPQDRSFGELVAIIGEQPVATVLARQPRTTDLYPMLSSDRTVPESFAYARVTPEEPRPAVVLSAGVQRDVERWVRKLRDLADTEVETVGPGILFTGQDELGDIAASGGARAILERAHGLCYVRDDADVEVRLASVAAEVPSSTVRASAAAYALCALTAHRLNGHPRFRGRVVWKLEPPIAEFPYGTEVDLWFSGNFAEDDFAQSLLPTFMEAARLGGKALEEREVVGVLKQMWRREFAGLFPDGDSRKLWS